MACRDSAKPAGKCQTAVANITKITDNQRISALPCDLSSFASVRSFATALKERVSKVDVLINNAGIAWNDPRLPIPSITDDGFDRVFQVNLLGHHLLVEEVLPLIRSVKGRIIHVSSASSQMACPWGKYPRSLTKSCTALDRIRDEARHNFTFPTDPQLVENNTMGVPPSNYGLSKYLMVFHAAEIALREAANGVTAFSLHPGVVDTDIVEQIGDITVAEAWCAGQKPCPRTAEQGASTQTYLATAPLEEISQDNGLYYDSCKASTSVKSLYSLTHTAKATAKYQAAIYDMCAEMTGSSAVSLTV